MANARPGGPRRPGLDYYEYKRLHEQRQQEENPAARSATPVVNPAAPASVQPRTHAAPEPQKTTPSLIDSDQDFSDNALDLPVDLESPEEKPKLFSGVKALVRGVSHRIPDDESEPDEDREEREPRKGSAPVPAEPEEDADDDLAEANDAPQIDNPIGDAFLKVKGLFQKARGRMAERQSAKSGGEAGEQDDDAPDAAAAESSAPSRRMRKATEAAEPPILAIEPVDVQEVDELVAKPGTTVRTGFLEDRPSESAQPVFEPEGEAIDDDDDLPAAHGTRMFGFFKKMRGRSEQATEENASDSARMELENQRVGEPMKAGITQLLAEDAGGPTLSRKERKALAAGKPVAAASASSAAPAIPEKPAATMPFATPAAVKTVYPVDEPTQQFRPLRPRDVKIAKAPALRQADPEIEDFDDEDEDDDLPVRRAPKPPKPIKEKKRRVYQDEDLEDEEYDRADRGSRGDRYDDYDEEEYDDYDDYDEEDERYEDEYHVSGGRRFLGFVKGLLVFILFLAMCVLALRQLEASHMISLSGLRGAVGQLSLILPSPAPEATVMPEVTAEPTLAPTLAPTPEPTAVPTAAPVETPGADITQVEPTAEAVTVS